LKNYRLVVVVPTLESYSILPNLFNSLLAQTYLDWSVLLVDGRSSFTHCKFLDHICLQDNRFSWIQQGKESLGIFGAMNHGFDFADQDAWLLFWGSDDWAPQANVFYEAMSAIAASNIAGFVPDLVVCRGKYVDSIGNLVRSAGFNCCSETNGVLNSKTFRRALSLGVTPPHQATLIGPGARARLSSYAEGFRLSGDLDYFLQLSRFPDLRVQVLDLELVHMSSGGISGQQTQRRLQEVRRAYQRAFGWLWWFPFIARYVRRLFSLLHVSR